MTQQVLYDTITARVLQWQDTDQFNYGAAPSGTETMEVTAAEWAHQAGTWYVVNGALTQTNPNAPTAAQLLEAAQTKQIATLTAAAEQAIQAGFVSSANGTALTYTLSFNDQRRALMAGQVATNGMAGAGTWVASTIIPANYIILQDSNYYVARIGGTTSSVAPTGWPTECAIDFTDNTVTWALFGLQLNTSQNGATVKVWLTAQQIEQVFIDGTNWVNACDEQLALLISQVNAATTASAVQAITWSNP